MINFDSEKEEGYVHWVFHERFTKLDKKIKEYLDKTPCPYCESPNSVEVGFKSFYSDGEGHVYAISSRCHCTVCGNWYIERFEVDELVNDLIHID